MPSPVLKEIKKILKNVHPDAFSDPIESCITKNKNGKKQCGNKPEREILAVATERMRSFAVLSEKFEKWKEERILSRVGHATPPPRPPAIEGSSSAHQSSINSPASSPVAQTPKKKINRDTTNTDEQDTDSDVFSSTTVSPSQESDIFSVASPASTAITTPGLTRSDERQSSRRSVASANTESRPETPTPAPRRPSKPATEPETVRPELASFLNQLPDNRPEVLGRVQRFNSVKSEKWPLLKAIETKFTVTDNKKGRVYIWTHIKDERLVKIGFTEQDSDARRRQSGNCYAKHTKPQWESPESFVGAFRVESIVQKDLREKNIALESCADCKKAHKEWFAMDWRQAKQVIEVWTRFVTVAYVNGRLSERAVENLEALCGRIPGKLAAALSAEMGPLQAEGLTIVSEESEAGQQTIILDDEQVSGLTSDEQICAALKTVPLDPPSTGQVSPDGTIPERNAALPSTGHAPATEGWAGRVFRRIRSTTKTHGSHPGRSNVSEQADGERGDNAELFLKLFKRFYSIELEKLKELREHEAKKMLSRSQSDPVHTRDDSQWKRIIAWMPKRRSSRMMAT
ncbi:hypothetical protein QBC46DRAFT_399421 [Diplogelasinospora grovesii]|uniref:Bacteriophage T5 Orf172 DNA-binding domain-containing protein n=1 Tax=Diplogelasinospora grovesii TaxID=303347 RepID=A0AAN6MW52_9PEZI|nr:hypothetical protein QBC46DRAFT_399421 [Diplogelasinospora grovesii]